MTVIKQWQLEPDMVIEFYHRCCNTLARASMHARSFSNRKACGYWYAEDGKAIPITQQAVDQCIENMEFDNHYPDFNAHPSNKPKTEPLKNRLNPVPYLRLCAWKGKKI
ncbi:hypothetical protein [Sessilibacter corallicola]